MVAILSVKGPWSSNHYSSCTCYMSDIWPLFYRIRHTDLTPSPCTLGLRSCTTIRQIWGPGACLPTCTWQKGKTFKAKLCLPELKMLSSLFSCLPLTDNSSDLYCLNYIGNKSTDSVHQLPPCSPSPSGRESGTNDRNYRTRTSSIKINR